MIGLPAVALFCVIWEARGMIRNLNQLNFEGYGTVSAERAPGSGVSAKAEERQSLSLVQGDAPIYRAVSEVWFY